MQNSRINVNEAGSPHAVVVDFHNAAWQLLDREQPYGFAFQKTAEHLGLEPTIRETDSVQRLYLYGSTESVKTHLHDLHRHIGIIAHTGARMAKYFQQHERDHLGRILGGLTQDSLPNVPDDATLMRTVGVMSYPFVDAVSSDLTEVYYARKPYWHGTNEPARHEDGTLMHRYDARDIGGFVIGWDGLAVRESVAFSIGMEPETANRLRWLSQAKGTRWHDEVHEAFTQFLNMPNKPAIEHQDVEPTDEDGYALKHQLHLSRLDIKWLTETYQPPEGTTFGDIIRFAVSQFLAKAAADPQLAEAMEQRKQAYLADRMLWLPPIKQ